MKVLCAICNQPVGNSDVFPIGTGPVPNPPQDSIFSNSNTYAVCHPCLGKDPVCKLCGSKDVVIKDLQGNVYCTNASARQANGCGGGATAALGSERQYERTDEVCEELGRKDSDVSKESDVHSGFRILAHICTNITGYVCICYA